MNLITESIHDYHRFDGEGAAPAGTGAADAGASEFLSSIGLSEDDIPKAKNDGAAVSKQETNAEENGGTDSEVGSHDDKSEFEALIGKDGKYHELYGKKVSEAIQSRFKNQADYKGQVDGYEQALAPIFEKYSVKPGDIEGLTKAIQNDDDIYRLGAEEAGLDIPEYKERVQLEREAQRGREIMARWNEEQERQRKYAEWESDSEKLKASVPGFDLSQEIASNERFAAMLDSGASVVEAFGATHMSEILTGMQMEAREGAENDIISAIHKQASRPNEGAMRHNPAIVRKADPSKFTSADIDEILKRVERGETMSF